MRRSFVMVCLIVLALAAGLQYGCGSGSGAPQTLLDFTTVGGTYIGTWHNFTFGSTGASTMVVNVNSTTKAISDVLTLQGNVFGSAAPAPETFNGTYTATGITLTTVSTTFGNLTLTVDQFGSVSGTGTNVPSPNVSKITFNGSWDGTTLNLSYKATLTVGGQATGSFILSKAMVL